MSKKSEIITTPEAMAHALVESIAVCNEMHGSVKRQAKIARAEAEKACHYAVALGLCLQTVKANTPHGGWGDLFTDRKSAPGKKRAEFGFSQDTALRYMKAAEGALNRPGLSAAAKKRILQLGEAPVLELTDEQHKDLDAATRGSTLRQLYLDLKIIRASATEKKTPKPAPNPKPEPPKVDIEADAFRCFVEPLNKLTRAADRGDLTLLTPEHLAEVAGTLRSLLDDIRNVNPA